MPVSAPLHSQAKQHHIWLQHLQKTTHSIFTLKQDNVYNVLTDVIRTISESSFPRQPLFQEGAERPFWVWFLTCIGFDCGICIV